MISMPNLSRIKGPTTLIARKVLSKWAPHILQDCKVAIRTANGKIHVPVHDIFYSASFSGKTPLVETHGIKWRLIQVPYATMKALAKSAYHAVLNTKTIAQNMYHDFRALLKRGADVPA